MNKFYFFRKVIGGLLTPILISCIATIASAQSQATSYEVEMMISKGEGKRDSRQVNAVIIFDKDKDIVIIRSRRSAEVYREFAYSDIIAVQHTYERPGVRKISAGDIALTAVTGIPWFIFKSKKERNWLTILVDRDFAILKVENDNYRQLLAEFASRKVKVVSQNEDSER